jgi:Holliday junction DNA helicase RuvA
MIGWLEGTLGHTWQENNRCGVLIICAGIGYEVQLSKELWLKQGLVPAGAQLSYWIHQIQREDGSFLFGFAERLERDLFRLLISVSGVGPQVAIALIGIMPTVLLVEALEQGNISLLSAAQGVGKRTAERLSLELGQKLERFKADPPISNSSKLSAELSVELAAELNQMLSSLGYGPVEIQQAISAVAPELSGEDSSSSETWLRETLRWLGNSLK